MRIITVYECRGCPYYMDYRCRQAPKEEGEFYRIVPDMNRKKGIIPDWCPLAHNEGERGKT